jgi:caspase domain-containing protein/uncharacterized protein DUF4189
MKMRMLTKSRFNLAIIASAMVVALIRPSLADTRVALVIGNGAYQNAPRLPNPTNDAAGVAEALKRAGFETILATDLTRAGMDEATIRFARAARTADVAMFYYSGHALQFAGVNYLAPVDVDLKDEADLRRMTRVDEVVTDLAQAKNLRILVLDSCRDNPLADQLKRSIGANRALPLQRGLAKIDSPEGMIVAYATQAGRTADDGDGKNSPYTTAFLKHIDEKEEIGSIFRRISADVYETTKHEQLPELSLSVIGEFYLNGRIDLTVRPDSRLSEAEQSRRDYEAAERIDTTGAWDAYLRAHPSGFYSSLAEERRRNAAARTAALPKSNDNDASKPAIRYGAVVFRYGRDVKIDEQFYYAWNFDNPDAAIKEAFARCDHANCRLVRPLNGNCFVLARPDHGHNTAFGWGREEHLTAAKDSAIKQCKTQGTDCEIVETICSDGSSLVLRNQK